MRAYVIERAGGPEVLKLLDLPSPEPKADEVRIRVRAFGLNRAEVYFRSGKMGAITGPRVPGIEAVGEIISDPSGSFRTGQRVATAMGGMQFTRNGSYAEEVAVLRSNVVDLEGTTLSWEELAALPESFLTAWGALSKSLTIRKGQTLLVRGATAAVGLASVVYAKTLAVRVVATTRSEQNTARLREVGADITLVDDGQIADDVRRAVPEGVDAALEVVGAATVRDTLKALKPFGAVTVIGLLGGPPVLENLDLMQELPGATRLSFFQGYVLGTAALPLSDAPLRSLADGIAKGRVPSLLTETFDFDQVPRGHAFMESDRALGKIVVRV
ncbi:MAG: alcohol dehydrogenase [Acidobacteria bacterium]|nr:MAG: alcohol dehydrogenase [Acidobacteriota bacterium]